MRGAFESAASLCEGCRRRVRPSPEFFLNSKGLSFSFPLPFAGRPRSAGPNQTFQNILGVLQISKKSPKISKIGPSNSDANFTSIFGPHFFKIALILEFKIDQNLSKIDLWVKNVKKRKTFQNHSFCNGFWWFGLPNWKISNQNMLSKIVPDPTCFFYSVSTLLLTFWGCFGALLESWGVSGLLLGDSGHRLPSTLGPWVQLGRLGLPFWSQKSMSDWLLIDLDLQIG